MQQRLYLLKELLSSDGHLFIHIDDNEIGYLMVVCDEIFGRDNRRSTITFKQSSVSGPKAQNPGIVTTANYILWYSKEKSEWKPNRGFRKIKRDSRYNKYIVNYERPFQSWKLENINTVFAKRFGLTSRELKKEFGDTLESEIEQFVLENPARVVRTARVKEKDVNVDARKSLLHSQSKIEVQRAVRDDKDDYYFLNGEQLLFYSKKARLIDGQYITGEPLSNIWDDLLSNNLHKEGQVKFPKGKKPEALIKRILELSTLPGDLVLDSFGGSGTTVAVAHKMRRQWITVELESQCETHIVPRLNRIVDGADKDGISKALNWQGGGGYRYYRLAASLLKKDTWGNWVINPQYNAEMLSEAMCKLMGYSYDPSQDIFWQQGQSTENNFIYVTTGTLSHDQLKRISNEVGSKHSLLICCCGFQSEHAKSFDNLTLKKIPQAVLHQCEWDQDDYSFNINVLPDEDAEQQAETNQSVSDAADSDEDDLQQN
jgi:adenine-specific DNA-methyltransferase